MDEPDQRAPIPQPGTLRLTFEAEMPVMTGVNWELTSSMGGTPPFRKRALGNFSRLPAAAAFDRRLSRAALRVLAAICTYCDKFGTCYPGIARIAAELDVSRQAVQRQIRKLEQLGYLITTHRKRWQGGNMSNHYQVVYPDRPRRANTRAHRNGQRNPAVNDDAATLSAA